MKAVNFRVKVLLCLFSILVTQNLLAQVDEPVLHELPALQPLVEPFGEPIMPLIPLPVETLQEKIERNFIIMGGEPNALTQAQCVIEKYKNIKLVAFGDPTKKKGIELDPSKYLLIFDLLKSSRIPRLFIVNLQTGDVEATVVAHGRGKGKQEVDNVEYANSISNENGSFLSSHGLFIIGEKYKMNNPIWKYGVHLYGLQKGVNDNVFKRLVVMHPDPGVQGLHFNSILGDDAFNFPVGIVQPLSWGCLMLPPNVAASIMDKLQMPPGTDRGTLLYSYSAVERDLGPHYCGQ